MTRRLLVVVLGLVLGGMSAQAQYVSREELKKPLAESVEKVLGDFVDRCVVEKEKQLTSYMETVMKEVDAEAELTPEEQKAMEAETHRAVVDSAKAWRPEGLAALRTYLSRTSNAAVVRQMGAWKPADVGLNEPVENWMNPEDDAAWLAALKTTLGEERFKRWQEVHAKVQKKAEEEINDYLERWVRESNGPMNEDLEGKIELMKTKLELPEERVAALKKAAESLLERITTAERKRGMGMLRPMPPEARRNIMGRSYLYLRFDRPRGEPWDKLWDEAAAAVLPAEIMTRWVKLMAEERKKEEAGFAELIKPSEGYLRQQLDVTMITEIDNVTSELNLDKERQDKLKLLSKQAVEESVKLGKEQWLQQVRNYSRGERKRMTANTYFGLNEEKMANSLPIWKDGLKKLLTEEEFTRMTQEGEQREQRTLGAIVRICLAEMDSTLMLSDKQRAALEPLLGKTMGPLLEQRRQQYWSYTPQMLFQSAGKVKEDAVKPLLDEVQWKRWRELVTSPSSPSRSTPPPVAGTQPAVPDMEAAISLHLYKMFMAERQKMMTVMMPRVEEAQRVLSLSEVEVARLSTAAKGAVEDSLDYWRQNTERYVRQAVQTATPQNVLQALAGTERVNYGRTTENDPASGEIWQLTLATSFDADQLKRLKTATQDRYEYRLRAMAAMSVAELDRRRHLRGEQCEKLEIQLRKILGEYLPDMERYMSGNWFLQYYYALVPMAGVAEKEMQNVLTPQQWKMCKERDLPDALQYWEGIENNHKNRIKQGANNAPIFQGGFIVD